MSTDQIIKGALALPLPVRVALAESLWQSIEQGLSASPSAEERATLAEAKRRDAELASGAVRSRSHQQVMKSARRALKCT